MKTLFLCLLLVLGSGAGRVMGQTPWVQAMSGGTQSNAASIATDATGNTYVGGSFTGTLTIAGTVLQAATTTAFGAYIAKYNPQGALLWVRQPTVPGASSRLGVESVVVDGSGNVLMGGTFSGDAWTLGNVTLPAHPAGALTSQGFVAKLDPAGSISWARAAVDASRRGTIDAVAVDASGTVYAAGSFNGSLASAFIQQYSAAGVLQTSPASPMPGGTGSLTITGLAISANGQQLALAGWLLGGSVTLQAAAGPAPALVVSTPGSNSSVGFVAGYRPNGEAQWVQTVACGPNNRARLTRVVATGSDFLACGVYGSAAIIGTSPVLTLPGSATYSSGLLARFSSLGAVQWAQGIQGSSYTEAWDVAADANGNAYVVGAFSGQLAATAGGLSSAGGFDPFLLVYAPQGGLLSAQRDGGTNQEFFTGVALTPAGQPRVAGYYTFGTGQIAGASLPSVSSNTVFVAGLANLVLATALTRRTAAFTVFPVPARSGDDLQLNIPAVQTAQSSIVRILDVQGREVRRQVLPAKTVAVAVSTTGLQPGRYILQVLSADGIATRGVVVE
ncbi:MAG: T9SS type A sorting domain-containing protein [Bacteroidota bacterium]|nr:T9SS type A sorting domain-containing protein [Bacteroidota bacterium]